MLDHAPRLRRALFVNASFSGLFGLALVPAREPLAAWFGLPRPDLLAGTGALLLAFAAHLFWARSRRIHLLEALHFAISDGVWVAATGALLVAAPETLSTPGRAVVLAVAAVVGVLAREQLRGMREARACSTSAGGRPA